jgi:hypothetical protein
MVKPQKEEIKKNGQEKIAEGPPANFAETHNQPDSLENAKPDDNKANAASIAQSIADKEAEAYKLLLPYVKFKVTTNGFLNKKASLEQLFAPFKNLYDPKSGKFETMAFESLSLNHHSQDYVSESIKFKVRTIKDYLEHPNLYGPNLVKSGMYELAELDKEEIFLSDLLKEPVIKIFPELHRWDKTSKIIQNVFYKTESPFISLFTMPVEDRRFYTAVTAMRFNDEIKKAIATYGSFPVSNKPSTVVPFPLTTKDIYKYAESIGQIENVAKYISRYDELEKNANTQ